MSTAYWRAPDVEEIAEKLIAEHHTHLRGVPITYVYRDTAAKSKGRYVLGKARKVSGLAAHLVHLVRHDEADETPDFFVIEIAHDMWKVMKEEQRIALIDHELCHLDVEVPDNPDEDRKLIMRGHDLEEFTQVVERHGLWRPPVKQLVDAANKQLALNLTGDGPDGA